MSRILIATSELGPFVQTGGLANAVAGLAGALARAGHEVTVVMPAYRHLRTVGEDGGIGGGFHMRRTTSDGYTVLMVDDVDSFDRDGIYGPTPGTGYADNWWRFGRFSRTAATMAAGYDLLHLQDAHTGAAALVSPIPTVFTVHNAAYPILGPLHEAGSVLGVGPGALLPGGALEWYGQANYLKAGIAAAGRVTTVSPGHALELSVDETSFGLGGVVRSRPDPLVGILNGIDTGSWDPETDEVLPAPFSADDPSGRTSSRRALLAKARLGDGVLFGNVGRMSTQKGLGLLDDALDDLVSEGLRLVLIGNGELDPMVDGWVERHPDSVAHFTYDEHLARLVSAGCDAYLMPSQFEPCGLGQMYSMRYGAPPVARYTGGLADSVVDVDEDPANGNGFVFRSFLPEELVKTVRRAMRYREALPELWRTIQARGMRTDWSWDARAHEYEAVYEDLLG